MTSPILFVGQEDIDFDIVSGLVAVGTAGVSVNTTAGYFRSGYARYALTLMDNHNPGLPNQFYIQTAAWASSPTVFWTSAQASVTQVSGALSNTQGGRAMYWLSSDGVIRLRLSNSVAGANVGTLPPVICNVHKIDSAGTATLLGTTQPMFPYNNIAKIDVYINYAVSGQITIWQNGGQVFNYTGDVTTDGITALNCLRLGSIAQTALGTLYCGWSEVIVSTRDTRNMSVVTQAPSGAGNTDAWTGTYTQVNGNTAGDSSPNYTAAAAQMQEYTVNGLPAGTFGIVSAVAVTRATMGATGPTKIDAVVRTGGVDYSSADYALSLAWSRVVNPWDVNPATSAAWQQSDLNAGAFNIGFKSVA